MNKELYDWEQDSELSTSSNLVNMPISDDMKFEKTFEAIEDGYRYSDNGLLQKKMDVKLNVGYDEEDDIVYFDPDDLKVDSFGRQYFLDNEGTKIYIDALGNVYDIRYDSTGQNIEEYMVVGKNKVLVFLDSSHKLAKSERGDVYEYNAKRGVYAYNPNIVLHPTSRSR